MRQGHFGAVWTGPSLPPATTARGTLLVRWSDRSAWMCPRRLPPAKPRGMRLRLERARRQPRRDVGAVVVAGRHVVGRVGVEDRGEILDLPAADAELELPAAVYADAAL